MAKKKTVKRAVKKVAARKPAAKKAPVKAKASKPAKKATAGPAATPYTPQPISGIGWAPFRYPLT